MNKTYETTIPGHPNIYDGSERDLMLYFNEPSDGIQANTGILLLPNDFGEDIASEESLNRRSLFADRYNMITLQCKYFGINFTKREQNPQFLFDEVMLRKVLSEEHMNYIYNGNSVDINKLFEVGTHYDIYLEGYERLNETISDFNDMGIMQGIDQLSAVYAVLAILNDNGKEFHANRICAYGRGHGGYLAQLANAFAPDLFHTVVTADSWLFPNYLTTKRMLGGQYGRLKYSIVFDYMARTIPFDRELLNLPSLYKAVANNAVLVALEAKDANDSQRLQKQSFYQAIKNSTYLELDSKDVMESAFEARFESNQLNINTLLEQFLLRVDWGELAKTRAARLPTHRWETRSCRYTLDFSQGMPIFNRSQKQGFNNSN